MTEQGIQELTTPYEGHKLTYREYCGPCSVVGAGGSVETGGYCWQSALRSFAARRLAVWRSTDPSPYQPKPTSNRGPLGSLFCCGWIACRFSSTPVCAFCFCLLCVGSLELQPPEIALADNSHLAADYPQLSSRIDSLI